MKKTVFSPIVQYTCVETKLKKKQYFPKSCSIFEVLQKNSTKYCQKVTLGISVNIKNNSLPKQHKQNIKLQFVHTPGFYLWASKIQNLHSWSKTPNQIQEKIPFHLHVSYLFKINCVCCMYMAKQIFTHKGIH